MMLDYAFFSRAGLTKFSVCYCVSLVSAKSYFSVSGLSMIGKFTLPGWAILAFSILAMLSADGLSPGVSSLHSYFYHYGEGYVHRGLIGHILRFFLGEVSGDVMSNVAVRMYVFTLVADMVMLWFLLVPRISDFASIRLRRVMLGVAAVILLAPIWKASASSEPFMDAYVLCFALLAYFALLKNRPLAFFVFLVLAMLAHRVGIFFGIAMGVLGLHAAWASGVHRQKWHWYAAVMAAQPVLFAILHFLNDPAVAERILETSGVPLIIREMDEFVVNNISASVQNTEVVWAGMKAHFLHFIVVVCAHFMPPFILACALPILLRGRLATSPEAVQERRVLQALPPLIVAMPVPIVFFGYDTSRFLEFSWWFLGFATMHYAWFCVRDGGEASREPSRWPPFVLAAAAWLSAGMYPSNSWMGHFGYRFSCSRICIPLVTDNFIMKTVAAKMANFRTAVLYPFELTLEHFSMFKGVRFHGLKAEDGALPVPKNFKKEIHEFEVSRHGGELLHVTVRHEASALEPFFVADECYVQRRPEKDSSLTETRWVLSLQQSLGQCADVSWHVFTMFRNPAVENASITSIDVDLR